MTGFHFPTRYTVSGLCWMTTRKTFVIQWNWRGTLKLSPGRWNPDGILFCSLEKQRSTPLLLKNEKKKRNNRSVTALKQQELVDVSLSQWNGFQESKMYL